MNRLKNLLVLAGLTAGMLFGLSGAARASDWDHDGWLDRHEQREHYREYSRDHDGRYFQRVWDPHRGWIVVPYYPPRAEWYEHDRGRHLGRYKQEHREWRDRDDY